MGAALGSSGQARIFAPQLDSRTPMTRTAQPSPRSLPGHVLVVEDDAILAMALEMALRDAGVEQVEISSTSEMALAALRAGQPDAIVLDVHLADRDDGWAVAELVRSLGRPVRGSSFQPEPRRTFPSKSRNWAVSWKSPTIRRNSSRF